MSTAAVEEVVEEIVEELEAAYKKSRLNSARNRGLYASSSAKDAKKVSNK